MLSSFSIISARFLSRGSGQVRPPSFQQSVNSMAKLLKGNQPRKRKPSKAAHTDSSSKAALTDNLFPAGAPTKGNLRRQRLLDSMFFEKITELFSTGEIGANLQGMNFQISRVKVSKEFNILHVYWVPNGTPEDAQISEILQRNAGLLRKTLTSLNLMGRIPHILFLQDRSQAQFRGVLDAIDTIQAGGDISPLRDQEITSKGEEEADEVDAVMPVLRRDIYGLKHADIMARVVSSMKKSKQRPEPPTTFHFASLTTSETSSGEPVDSSAVIRNFLKKQEAQKESKIRKARREEDEADDFYLEEAKERAEREFERRFQQFMPEGDDLDSVR